MSGISGSREWSVAILASVGEVDNIIAPPLSVFLLRLVLRRLPFGSRQSPSFPKELRSGKAFSQTRTAGSFRLMVD